MKQITVRKFEKIFFLFVVVLNLKPVLSAKFFPTLDGPAHLYNSNLINHLLTEDNPVLHQFFEFNDGLIPNWTGHFFLSFFNFFLPAFAAEKAVLVLLLVGMAYAFRALIKTVTPDNYLFSYFIFPFTYSFVFFLGFYNFCFGLVFLLVGLNYWIKIENSPLNAKKIAILFLLITATYFSHILPFALLLLFIGIRLFVSSLIDAIKDKNGRKEVFRKLILKSGGVLIAVAFPLTLFFIYLSSIPASDNRYLELSTLLEWIEIVKPVIALNGEVEGKFTELLYLSYLGLIGLIIYTRLVGLRYRRIDEKKRFIDGERLKGAAFWMVVLMSVLYLYFTMADGDANAGEVSVRLILMAFLVIILWFSTQRLHPIIVGFFALISLFCNFKLNNFYETQISVLSYIAKDCEEVADHIEPNSVVLPLDYSNHWMMEHFSNYLGIDKPMIILENYECTNAYFPLKWRDDEMPNVVLGDQPLSNFSCNAWRTNENNDAKNIDYVFILGKRNTENKDECQDAIQQVIKNSYKIVFSNENCELFKRKE